MGAPGGGPGPAPSDAQYLVLAADSELVNERVFTAGDGLEGTDAGAGGSYTLAVDLVAAWSGLEFDSGDLRVDEDAAFTWTSLHTFTATPAIEIDVASGDPAIVLDTQGADRFTIGVDDSDSDKFKINSGGSLADPSDFELDSNGNVEIGGDFNFLTGKGVVHSDSAAGNVLVLSGGRYVPGSAAVGDVSGLDDVQFVVLAASGDLTNERVLTAGDGIDLTDAGAGNAVTVAVDLVAAWSGLEFSGADLRVDEDAAFTWTAAHTHNQIIMTDGGTIGQAAGPLLTFDDTNNYLEITGCRVGVNATAPPTRLEVRENDAVTDDITDVNSLNHSSSGTPAALFGVGLKFLLESTTSGGQNAARVAALWTDATHASRNELFRINTYPGGVGSVGYCGFWTGDDVDDNAQTVIPNGTGDVGAMLWCAYIANEVGGGVDGGTATVTPGNTADLYDDGTDVLTLAVAADGSVTISRTAGAASFDVMLWMVWT